MKDMETQEFYLTAPRYLRQVGQSEPELVVASAYNPVKVVLPAKLERRRKVIDKDTKRVTYETDVIDHPEDATLVKVKPDRPEPAHAGAKKGRVKKSHEVKEKKSSDLDFDPPPMKVREADK